jgi:hypothetical protein
MKLSWSTCARSRAWSKAIRRVRPRFDSLETAFAAVGLRNPIHEVILVGITDERGEDYFEEVPNSDGYFQVLVGFNASINLAVENDRQLEVAVFRQLSRAILACPFARQDQESIKAAIGAWAKANLTRWE